ncbi:hypothetical protein ACWJJH_10960 [Endozoicomonadaceae bacterium StTr2]
MSGDHFTLTISQSASDNGDFAIHIKEKGQREKLLVHLRFVDTPMLDEHYLDEVVGAMARKLAKRIIEWRIKPGKGKATMEACEAEAKEIVAEALERMKREEE